MILLIYQLQFSSVKLFNEMQDSLRMYCVRNRERPGGNKMVDCIQCKCKAMVKTRSGSFHPDLC